MKRCPAGLQLLLSVPQAEAIGAYLVAAPQLWLIWAERILAKRSLLPNAQDLVCAKALLQRRDLLEGVAHGNIKKK